MNEVYPEGMSVGLHWVWDEMVEYDVREKTLIQKFEFNDKDNMVTQVELALDYRLSPDKINLLHTKITDVETKIIKTLKSWGHAGGAGGHLILMSDGEPGAARPQDVADPTEIEEKFFSECKDCGTQQLIVEYVYGVSIENNALSC